MGSVHIERICVIQYSVLSHTYDNEKILGIAQRIKYTVTHSKYVPNLGVWTPTWNCKIKLMGCQMIMKTKAEKHFCSTVLYLSVSPSSLLFFLVDVDRLFSQDSRKYSD